jgi:hypothetical protein
MSDQEPRSAVEIAMERLRQKDVQDGVEHQPLTADQKAAIAEVRRVYAAKFAQAEIMHNSALAECFDPAVREALEESHRRDRERLTAERDATLERIRRENAKA